MDHRLDALLGFARVVEAVNQLGLDQGAEGRATVGMANIFPNSHKVERGGCFFSIEFRHPDDLRPCVDGLSHNEAEHIHPAWATAGANVLLHSILAKAGGAGFERRFRAAGTG